MKRVIAILFVVGLAFTFSCGFTTCSKDQTVSTGIQILQATKTGTQTLLSAAQWAAPIASIVVSAYGDQDAQAAMKMASASLGTLSTLVDKASTQDQTNAAFSALQVAWAGIDSAYKNDPQAVQKLQAIQVATEAAKALITQAVSPVPTS